MALVVEDGHGLINSESYMTVDEATQYHADRANDAWGDGDTVAWEAALRRATEWIDAAYRGKFIGYRTKAREQALEWPRTGAYVLFQANGPWPLMTSARGMYGSYLGQWSLIADTEIPYELKRATAEAALRELVTPGILLPDVNTRQVVRSVAISGSVSVTFAGSDPNDRQTLMPIIDATLRPLLDISQFGGSKLFGQAERNS